MSELYLNGKKCVTAVVIHVDGKALLLHDQVKQCISTAICPVQRDHLVRVLEQPDTLPLVIREHFDYQRFPIEAAYALAALDKATTYFKLEGVESLDNLKMLRATCAMTQIVLDTNKNDYKMMAFSIDVDGLANESKDDLAQRFIMVDRTRVYTKPDAGNPRNMSVYFMGLKMTQMSGLVCLLFWDTCYIN